MQMSARAWLTSAEFDSAILSRVAVPFFFRFVVTCGCDKPYSRRTAAVLE
jgi:hypothetical protein